MKRRDFIAASSLAALTAAAGRAQDAQKQSAREFYEIRRYGLQIGDKRGAGNNYLKNALVPALNRAGLKPVGVFDTFFGEIATLVVLIPHQSIESVVALPARLNDDAEHRKAGAEFLDAPSSSPAFERIESSLLVAFEKMPKLELPDVKKPRVFELRRYESHSERALKKKLEMFNEAGEIALFRRVGFRPVFFGETLVGARMPNFEYLLTFDNLAAREKIWAEFRADPEWKKMSAIPGYQDNLIVSHVGATMLNPTPYSQI